MQNDGSVSWHQLSFAVLIAAIGSIIIVILNSQICHAVGLENFATVTTGQLKEPFNSEFAQNNITGWNPFECAANSSKLNATGDLAKVMSAKNADKSFFNGSGDVSSAQWSDTDTESMRRLVETYGDLAYQMGNAVGAPWIAVLVQMRYEDPLSVCGRNNFWGNGCPPGTGVGGASKQGNNLGEGFVMYAETLTNGYHDQALGVADPKEYLEKIGPTWVQGDPNGPGYGSIGAMKQSVDALQAFVDSPEGQAIVQEFGSYNSNGTTEPITGDKITWIGDSYSVGAHSIIEEKFSGISFGNGIESPSSYIQSNKGVSDRYGGGEANPPALTILKRVADAGELKPYLVMAVGTNAGWTDEEVEEFKNIMSSHPDTKVVFVNAKAKAHLMSDDNGTNERLKALANESDNYALADWAAAYDDSYFANNSTHPDANGGYEKWVSVISDALNSLGASPSDSFCPCPNGTTEKNTTTEWEEGWIKSGSFDGYVKEPAEGSGYGLPEEAVNGGHTQEYSTDGKPNKILLHSTEGGSGNGDSGLALYGSITKGGVTGITPAHFTINLQDKKVFQHFSIDKPSDAIIEDLDAGIQIEIIGFMGDGSPSLKDFSDEDWNYLAKLLLAISDQTGIKLESTADWTHTNRYSENDFRNYTGVLGHMHAPSNQNHDDPGDIWSKVSEAIERMKGNSGVCGGNGDFASYVLKYAWPEYRYGDINKDEYQTDQVRRSSEGIYTGSNGFTHTDQLGVDCGGFVTAITQESKMDPNYNDQQCNTICQIAYAKEHYERVTDTSQLQPGDIAFSDDSSRPGHTWIYVGEVDGFDSNIASASWGERSPCAGTEGTNGAWYHNPNPGGE